MKKFKIVISIILVMMLAITSSVTAFATTDEELSRAIRRVRNNAKDAEMEFVYYNSLYTTQPNVPIWSDESTENMEIVVETILNEIDFCETIEEVNAYQAMLDEAIEKMCISSDELQWMIDYMEKDYNNYDNYYDEETYAELKTIYENAQKALESGVDLEIHNAYIDMRNELNKLCAYNSVYLDVDNDGEFTIKDCTLMQMQIAKMANLTSSQRYVGRLYKDANITEVTNAQMLLVDLSEYTYDPYIKTDFVELDPSVRNYFGSSPDYQGSNQMFYFDCYYFDGNIPL